MFVSSQSGMFMFGAAWQKKKKTKKKQYGIKF